MEPAYPAARAVAATVRAHFAGHIAAERRQGRRDVAPEPDSAAIEEIVDRAFWASLRREEGRFPKISLAFLPPDLAGHPMMFESRLRLDPATLTRLAPAVERPGIHLGVWREHGALRIWGTTRTIPLSCFVLEVVEPGLLVVKRRRSQESGKYANVVVLHGDQVRVVDGAGTQPDLPPLLASLLGADSQRAWTDPESLIVQLAVSMRAHRRGGSLLVVPDGSTGWRSSIVEPIAYTVSPPFDEFAALVRSGPQEREQPAWREAVRATVEWIAGLTAVDGATVITDRYELLAFGAKIGRPASSTPVQRVIVAEPVVGVSPAIVDPGRLGGTRHLSAAQFVHDQRDALALVASQDGRFTAFAWSAAELAVRAYRVETLLL